MTTYLQGFWLNFECISHLSYLCYMFWTYPSWFDRLQSFMVNSLNCGTPHSVILYNSWLLFSLKFRYSIQHLILTSYISYLTYGKTDNSLSVSKHSLLLV
jgi:hypothetical protein